MKAQVWVFYKNEFTEKFMHRHGFCNCANPDELINQVRRYLKRRKHPINTSNKDLLMAYFCDKYGYTDHGGSVFGAWVSQKGEKLLKEMEENEILYNHNAKL